MTSKLNKEIWGVLANYVTPEEARKILRNELGIGELQGFMTKYGLDIISLKQKLKGLENELQMAEDEVYSLEGQVEIVKNKLKRLENDND